MPVAFRIIVPLVCVSKYFAMVLRCWSLGLLLLLLLALFLLVFFGHNLLAIQICEACSLFFVGSPRLVEIFRESNARACVRQNRDGSRSLSCNLPCQYLMLLFTNLPFDCSVLYPPLIFLIIERFVFWQALRFLVFACLIRFGFHFLLEPLV